MQDREPALYGSKYHLKQKTKINLARSIPNLPAYSLSQSSMDRTSSSSLKKQSAALEKT